MGAVMKLRLFLKLKESAGQSIVELALVLPVLVVLVLGIFDLSRAIHANNIISNMSREGANLVSRSSAIEHQAIMNSLAATARPLEMRANGRMYITEVKQNGGVQLNSQETWPNGTYGPPASRATDVFDSMKALPKSVDSIQIFEVMYTYRSVFLPSQSFELHSATVF
jgi:Flp pilus assembly protein TadG